MHYLFSFRVNYNVYYRLFFFLLVLCSAFMYCTLVLAHFLFCSSVCNTLDWGPLAVCSSFTTAVKAALRSATLAQLLCPNPRGSYVCSDGEALVSILDKPSQVCFGVTLRPTDCLKQMDVGEGFIKLSDYAVSQVKRNFKRCNECAAVITVQTFVLYNNWLHVK